MCSCIIMVFASNRCLREILPVFHAVFHYRKSGDIMGYLSDDIRNIIAFAIVCAVALKQFLKTLKLFVK